MRGYELVAEPGSAAWHELRTKDYEAAKAVYQNIFGWDTDVMSDNTGRSHGRHVQDRRRQMNCVRFNA